MSAFEDLMRQADREYHDLMRSCIYVLKAAETRAELRRVEALLSSLKMDTDMRLAACAAQLGFAAE